MGRKFNLNLNPIEGQTIFHGNKELVQEMKEGTRKKIKWEPIELVPVEPHRWNSLELNKQQESKSSIEDPTKILMPYAHLRHTTSSQIVSAEVQDRVTELE